MMSNNDMNEAGIKPDEEISWDDVQEELAASASPSEKPEVRSVSFEEMTKTDGGNGGLDLDFILDIPLTLTAELGKTQMLIGDLLRLGQGSVVELAKLAGEPMDVFVNNRLIARGEVVVVNDKFGIRLTDVISAAERVSKLK
ncbi:MAG: flagellar motor switch protein FliN [Deltaproteobacteria bacterium]|nr:flagellar motor switch protein FliN [Deltaproteobacteria bacterium]MBN2688786.1 flagellar motor switch protein FliN [Deltaproteobacteria bacterium]